MEGGTGIDPRTEIYCGDDHPTKCTWVETQPTDHLFYASLHTDVTCVRVQAADRFGRT